MTVALDESGTAARDRDVAAPVGAARDRRVLRYVALGFILIVAAFLRFRGIGEASLWADEGLTVRILRLPVGEMLQRIRDWEQTPPLYYYLMRAWVALAGESEAALRVPSAIFGIASVGAIYVLASRMFGVASGSTAAALMAVSPYQIAYSQEARVYALFVLLTIVSCDLFVRVVQQRWPRSEVFYVLITALLLYTHLYAIFVVAAQNLAYLVLLVIRRERAVTVPRWVILNVAVAALYAPWAPTVWMWVKGVRAGFWVKPMTLDEISASYELYAGSAPLLVLLVALAVVGAVGMRRSKPGSVVLLVGLTVLPVVLPVLLSVIGRPTFVNRYAMFAAVGLFVLAGAGITYLRPIARVTVVMLLVALSWMPTRSVEGKPQWREAGRFLEANMGAGDFAAVHRKGATCMYDYYVNRPDVRRIGFDGTALPVTQPLPQGKRIWLVLYTNLYPPRRHLERGNWRVGRQKQFRDVLIFELIDASPTRVAQPPPAVTSSSIELCAQTQPRAAVPHGHFSGWVIRFTIEARWMRM